MAIIKNPPMLATGSGGGSRTVTNGVLGDYLAYGADVPANAFVEFVEDGGVTKVRIATSTTINGVTQTVCTAEKAGKVWVYGNN